MYFYQQENDLNFILCWIELKHNENYIFPVPKLLLHLYYIFARICYLILSSFCLIAFN